MNTLAKPIQGDIGQETLTEIVSRDELVPQRKRQPWVDIHSIFRRPYEAGMCILRITFCKLTGQSVSRFTACWNMDSESVWEEAPRHRNLYESCCRQRQPSGMGKGLDHGARLTVSLPSDFGALPANIGNAHSPYHASPFQDAGTYGAGTGMITSQHDSFNSYLSG